MIPLLVLVAEAVSYSRRIERGIVAEGERFNSKPLISQYSRVKVLGAIDIVNYRSIFETH